MKIFSLSNNKCESEKENIPLRSHRIVQLTDGTAAEITRVFVFCFTVLYLIVQCIEIRILDNGFTAQRQFPFELKIIERVPIQMKLGKNDAFYLLTKKEKMGHLLTYPMTLEEEEQAKKDNKDNK